MTKNTLGLARGAAREYVEYDAAGQTVLRNQALRSLRETIPPGASEAALLAQARREAYRRAGDVMPVA